MHTRFRSASSYRQLIEHEAPKGGLGLTFLGKKYNEFSLESRMWLTLGVVVFAWILGGAIFYYFVEDLNDATCSNTTTCSDGCTTATCPTYNTDHGCSVTYA